ncbi:MAG: site-specific DNA-methyltransferase [Flavobacteriaceae bacterium]|nr:MAG: site-specific DNA-methyltransferase [Flavobacteriaceae bacterium]
MEQVKNGNELTKSLDMVNENISRLKELFPEVVTEGKIDFKVLQDILGNEIEEGEEYYRFTWAGKAQARREAHKPSTGTLRPAKEESLDWDSTQNLYIEGDNLEVLKLLQKSYAGKIKMIYIDPPYNTGKDFVYKDNYKDNLKNYQQITGQVDDEGNKLSTNSESDGRYHSNWLNMMFPRLWLAKNLLKEDGVIFISIDDNEVENLKKIGNEVFGEDAFITTFCWEKKKKPSFLNRNLGTKFEYIHVFAKHRESTGPFSVELTTEGKKYPFNNAGNGISVLKFPAKAVKFHLDDTIIKPQNMSEGKIKTTLLDEVIIKNNLNQNEFRLEGEWRYSQDKLNQIVENGEEIIISKIPFRPNHVKSGGEIKKMHNLLTVKHYDISTNEDADFEQTQLLGQSYFDYSKPTGLIKLFIKAFMHSDLEGIVLDFFSGSGTTADAIMQMNLEDNGKRKSIQVQLPERIAAESDAYKAGYRNIADIGKARIGLAAKKLAKENPDKAKDLDLGFKVFKLDSSNIKGWDGNPDNLKDNLFDSQDNIKTDRTEEDVLYEILLKYGLDLTLPIEEKLIEGKKVFSIGYGALFICLADKISNKVAEGIGKWKEELNPEVCRVIFKDSGFNDVEKTNATQTLKRFGINEIKSI